jgi:hypothetical protein
MLVNIEDLIDDSSRNIMDEPYEIICSLCKKGLVFSYKLHKGLLRVEVEPCSCQKGNSE